MFLVLSLPRSRSKWMSRFLSYDGMACHHDPSADFTSLNDLAEFLHRPDTGACDTALALLWPQIVQRQRKAILCVVRRALPAVMASLDGFGVPPNEARLKSIDCALDAIENLPCTLSLPYSALGTEKGCAMLFEHCLEKPFDRDWWQGLAETNIQVCRDEEMARFARNRAGIRQVFGPVLEQLK